MHGSTIDLTSPGPIFSRRSSNPAGSASEFVIRSEAARSSGLVVHDLTRTDPTGWIDRAESERRALSLLVREEARRYLPDSSGSATARQALARTFGGSEDDWVLCASTSEAYSILFQLLADPGDRVAVCRPSYPLLDDLSRHGGIGLAEVPLRWLDGRWNLEIGRLEKVLSNPKVRFVVLIQPGNPTGWWLSSQEREKVLSICAKFRKPIVCDEVFAEDLHEEGFRSLHGESRCLVFVLGGLSKTLGLPHLKLGWIHMSGPCTELQEARERLVRLNDCLLSASTPVQLALADLLHLKKELRGPIEFRTRSNHQLLSQWRCPGVEVLPSGGGWVQILRLEEKNEVEVSLALLDRGVLVHPGFLYDIPGNHLVVSLLCEEDSFRSGLSSIVTVL